MKAFAFTLVAVLVGIWAWSKLTKPAGAIATPNSTTAPNESAPFQGPEIDPLTGSYLPPSSQPGTVSFPQSGQNGGYVSANNGTKL